MCPICHDAIGWEGSVILPCGHQMHTACSEQLVAKSVSRSTPYPMQRVNCPTCRVRTHVADIAYVDAGLTHGSRGAGEGGAGGSGAGARAAGPWAGEAEVAVRGSYGTKVEAVVRRVKFVLGQDPAAKVRQGCLQRADGLVRV